MMTTESSLIVYPVKRLCMKGKYTAHLSMYNVDKGCKTDM